MFRFSYLGALLSLACLAAPSAAQHSAPVPPEVQRVLVRGTGDAMEVEIQTSSSPVSPDTQAITGPDRIVVDFPGMLPSTELRALKVNQGPLKAVRSGLFFNNPPITRIVLDLTEPREYRISTTRNGIVVKLGSATTPDNQVAGTTSTGVAHLQNASLSSAPNVPAPRIADSASGIASTPGVLNANHSNANSQSETATPLAEAVSPQPAKPAVKVTYESGMLTLHAEKATLAEVLFEVHQQTQADIPIPAGAEQEQVIADLGPAPARDVLAELLNGSSYNFIFIGNELSLERVILTRRDSLR